jgi:hypothetical protein
MIYEPVQTPDRKDLSTPEIHADIDEMTGDGFDGIAALNGVVRNVVGDLSDSDIAAIEDYLGVVLIEKP